MARYKLYIVLYCIVHKTRPEVTCIVKYIQLKYNLLPGVSDV